MCLDNRRAHSTILASTLADGVRALKRSIPRETRLVANLGVVLLLYLGETILQELEGTFDANVILHRCFLLTRSAFVLSLIHI